MGHTYLFYESHVNRVNHVDRMEAVGFINHIWSGVFIGLDLYVLTIWQLTRPNNDHQVHACAGAQMWSQAHLHI